MLVLLYLGGLGLVFCVCFVGCSSFGWLCGLCLGVSFFARNWAVWGEAFGGLGCGSKRKAPLGPQVLVYLFLLPILRGFLGTPFGPIVLFLYVVFVVFFCLVLFVFCSLSGYPLN